MILRRIMFEMKEFGLYTDLVRCLSGMMKVNQHASQALTIIRTVILGPVCSLAIMQCSYHPVVQDVHDFKPCLSRRYFCIQWFEPYRHEHSTQAKGWPSACGVVGTCKVWSASSVPWLPPWWTSPRRLNKT